MELVCRWEHEGWCCGMLAGESQCIIMCCGGCTSVGCGAAVTTCNRASTALALLRERPLEFDLVISDVHMPDMDGFKLLELIGLEMELPVISKCRSRTMGITVDVEVQRLCVTVGAVSLYEPDHCRSSVSVVARSL